MKTTFKSNEIAHIWANQSAPRGTSPGAMSFQGDSFYSYGTAIARHITRNGKQAVILNVTGYSATTSKHLGLVHRALSSAHQVFRIGNIGRGCSLDFYGKEGKVLFEYALKRAVECEQSADRSRKESVRATLKGSAATWMESAREINAFFGLRRKVDEQSISRLRKASETAEKKAAVEAEKRDAAERAKQQEGFEAWLRGEENEPFNARLFPVSFRVEDDELVSTYGARVPVTAARVALKFALHHRSQNWHRNGEQCEVGHYQLDAVNAQGVVAGCHRIAWSEVERVAGLIESEVA